MNWDNEEQKLSDIMFELFVIICLTWSRVPRVSLFSPIEASKSTKNSTLGSTDIQVLMAIDTISFPIRG